MILYNDSLGMSSAQVVDEEEDNERSAAVWFVADDDDDPSNRVNRFNGLPLWLFVVRRKDINDVMHAFYQLQWHQSSYTGGGLLFYGRIITVTRSTLKVLSSSSSSSGECVWSPPPLKHLVVRYPKSTSSPCLRLLRLIYMLHICFMWQVEEQ